MNEPAAWGPRKCLVVGVIDWHDGRVVALVSQLCGFRLLWSLSTCASARPS